VQYTLKWRSGHCAHEAYTGSEKTAMILFVELDRLHFNPTLWNGDKLIAGIGAQPGVSPQPNAQHGDE
jgi:hypothetical protein